MSVCTICLLSVACTDFFLAFREMGEQTYLRHTVNCMVQGGLSVNCIG